MILRDRDGQAWWAKRLFFVGVAFLLSELVLGNSMSPRTYGFAAYDVDASMWAQGFMAASALVLYGLFINGRWPLWSPLMRLAGWIMLSGLFLFLAISAWTAEDGLHIVIFAVVFFLPRTIPYAVMNARDLYDRRRADDRE